MRPAALAPEAAAVLLDGLGTLIALEPPWPRLVRWLHTEHDLRLAPGDAERALRAEIAYYRAHHCEGRDADTLADLRRRCAEVLRRELPAAAGGSLSTAQLTAALLGALRFSAYPEVPATLRALRARGLTLVVVSNWDVSLPGVLNATGLADALDKVITSAAVGAPKPKRAIFEAALALAGVPARRAAHVGDSLEHDVLGARAAGVAPVLLRRTGEGSVVADTGGLAADTVHQVAASPASAAPGELPAGVPVIASLAELLA
jgi:putative hydrolase of the HAD superfamily